MGKMILHNINKLPEGCIYQHGSLTGLDEYDEKELRSVGVDEAWFWYAQGSYEGSGQILMRNGDQFATHDMGHCSCYKPIERLSPKWEPLETLRARYEVNKELWTDVAELFARASDRSGNPPKRSEGDCNVERGPSSDAPQ